MNFAIEISNNLKANSISWLFYLPLSVEFWNREAYTIARKITSDRDIHRDLVAFVYILLHDKGIVPQSLPATFARWAYQQYNWKDSAFNKQYANYHLDIDSIDYDKIDEKYQESKYGRLIDEYFDQESQSENEFFCKEIAKLVFQSMSYREIERLTGIRHDIVCNAIKQFRNDFRDFCSNRSSATDIQLGKDNGEAEF